MKLSDLINLANSTAVDSRMGSVFSRQREKEGTLAILNEMHDLLGDHSVPTDCDNYADLMDELLGDNDSISEAEASQQMDLAEQVVYISKTLGNSKPFPI